MSRVLTHCRRGHPFTPENSYVRSDGTGKVCKTCRRVAQQRFEVKRVARTRADRQKNTLQRHERMLIIGTLKLHNWNRTHAARELGLSIRTMRDKIKIYREQGFKIPGYRRWPDHRNPPRAV